MLLGDRPGVLAACVASLLVVARRDSGPSRVDPSLPDGGVDDATAIARLRAWIAGLPAEDE